MKREKKPKQFKVAHILPGMYFGGVEIAILNSFTDINSTYNYKIYYVRGKGDLEIGQKHILSLFKNILNREFIPDLVVTSLWWGHLVGILLSLFGFKWVCFIHSTGSSSFLDKTIIRLALKFSNHHFFDSQSTKKFFGDYKSYNSFVIPYVFHDKDIVNTCVDLKYDFSWIGRNSDEKRLDLLVKFINSLQNKKIDFKCIISIAGNPHEELDKLSDESNGQIKVLYNTLPKDIKKINYQSKIILCFSDYEGFSVSTAEAAIRGNLVAARNVGELHQYLCNKSTIWLEEDYENKWDSFVDEIIEVLQNEKNYMQRRNTSLEYIHRYFANKSYIESISKAFSLTINY